VINDQRIESTINLCKQLKIKDEKSKNKAENFTTMNSSIKTDEYLKPIS
jgi:hypothetical protein